MVHPAAQHRLEASPLLGRQDRLALLDRAEPRDPEVGPELRHLAHLGLDLREVHRLLLEQRGQVELGDPDVGAAADRFPREVAAEGLQPGDLIGAQPELGPVVEHDGDERPLRGIPHHPPMPAHGAHAPAPGLHLLGQLGAEASEASRQLVDQPAGLLEGAGGGARPGGHDDGSGRHDHEKCEHHRSHASLPTFPRAARHS